MNTPIDKLPQMTDMPDGCIPSFSGMGVNNVVGTKSKGKKVLYAEEYMNNFSSFRRSKNGMFLLGILKLALEQTATESNPDTTTGFLND